MDHMENTMWAKLALHKSPCRETNKEMIFFCEERKTGKCSWEDA